MTPLSPETTERIKAEAEEYAEEYPSKYDYYIKTSYTAGATAYAHYKERWEQAKKALEEIVEVHRKYRGYFDENRESNHLRNIAYEALSTWKEEGNNNKTDNNG